MQVPKTVTLELDQMDAGTLSHLIRLGCSGGDPLVAAGAHRLSAKMRTAVAKAMPPEAALDAIDEIIAEIPEDAPDEVREEIAAFRREIEEAHEITEEEVEAADVDDAIDRILADTDGPSL